MENKGESDSEVGDAKSTSVLIDYKVWWQNRLHNSIDYTGSNLTKSEK